MFPREEGPKTFHFKLIGDEITDKLCQEFLDTKPDIIFGDFVIFGDITYRNNNTRIYNGIDIIDFDTDINDTDGNIPKEFRCIENDVPLDYWQDHDFDYLCWINMDLFRDQCLNNIRILSKYFLITYFTYNNKKYNIIHPSPDIDSFKDKLNIPSVSDYYRYFQDCIDEYESPDKKYILKLKGGFEFDCDYTLYTLPNECLEDNECSEDSE